MNDDRMRAVADLIELEDRFDYSRWVNGAVDAECASEAAAQLHRCGTSGCVAGWAAHLALREGFRSDAAKIDEFAANYLGLTEDQALSLFFGWAYRDDLDVDARESYRFEDVSAVEIAKFLRRVADREVTL